MAHFFRFLILFFLLSQYATANQKTDAEKWQKAEKCFQELKYICALTNYTKYLSSLDSDAHALKYFQTKLKIGRCHFELGDFDQALTTLGELKEPNSTIQIDSIRAESMQLRARIFWRQGRNVMAVDEILQSISYFEALADTSNIVESSNTLGGIYVSLGEYENGQNLYRKSLALATQIKDSTNIAFSNEYLGIIEYFQGNYKEALNRYTKTLAINKSLKDSIPISINLSNIGEVYIELGEPKTALKYFEESIAIQENNNFMSGLVFSYYSLGRIYTELEELAKGVKFYNKSLQTMQESGETRERNYVYKLISENYEKQGDFQTALNYYKKHSEEKASIFNLEKGKQLDEIKTRYDVDKKEQQNIILKLENEKNVEELKANKSLIQLQYSIGILISIFLLIFVFFAVKLYKVRHTLITANKSKDKLFGIIAHDLKGPIGNVDAMLNLLQIETDEKRKTEYFTYLVKTVKDLLVLTNQLLSWNFTVKGDFNFKIEEIPLKEISDRSVALFDYQLNQKSIRIKNSISDQLYVLGDENALLTIFRNVISNAVKFTGREGEIALSAEKINSCVEIRIEDNGVGMSEEIVETVLQGKHVNSRTGTLNESGSGLGFSIIIEFVKKLNGTIEIESKKGIGTAVIIKLPLD